MSEYRRFRLPGASIYFTVCLAQRGTTLLTDEIDRLRLAVAQTRAERPFTIDAFVVLPDHLHCIWTLPERDSDYATRWRLIKSRFSRGLPRRRSKASQVMRQERGIWQRRFWEHHLRDDSDFRLHVAHCLQNPVRHGLVETAEEWPFSSIHRDRRRGHLT